MPKETTSKEVDKENTMGRIWIFWKKLKDTSSWYRKKIKRPLKNRNEHVLKDGTIIRTDIVEYNPLCMLTLEEYLAEWIITKKGFDRIKKEERYMVPESDYILKVMEWSEKALIPFSGMVYEGAIMSRIQEDGICYVEFRDWEWNTKASYFPEEAVKPDKIVDDIREIRKTNWDFKEWDKVFLDYRNTTILGRICEKDSDNYKIEIWIITKDNLTWLGIIQMNVGKVNEFNDDIISKIDSSLEKENP